MSGLEDKDQEKILLIQQLLAEQTKLRKRIEKSFIPWDRSAKPFTKQINFFRDNALSKLVRCGNRSAKTFSTMRDLSWKIMRNHPYRAKWNEDYENSSPKIIWVIGPTFEFIHSVAWEQYLRRFIPNWYYTNDDGEEMVAMSTWKGEKIVDKVTFRNGDIIQFRTYSQNILAQMGRTIDIAVLDEMPPRLMIISEIVTRCFDKSGEMVMGFTPLNPDPEIREYLDNHEGLSTHSWSIADNPLYANDEEKLNRALSEWQHLPNSEREARLHGAWYYEGDTEQVFANVLPDVVEDFEIPDDWRQVRAADPAAHITGYAIMAEDPETHIWYVTIARELQWKGAHARAENIEKEIDKHKPFQEYEYVFSLYDNHECWFGTYASKKWRPCIHKNKADLILTLRSLIVDGRIRFFAKGARLALRQIQIYRRKHNGAIVKRDDHALDALMYACRELPPPTKRKLTLQEASLSRERRAEAHRQALQEKWASRSKPDMMKRSTARYGSLLKGRGRR